MTVGNMSTLMQILNLYATRDSQTKFDGNCMKNGKDTVLRFAEEKEEEEEEEKEMCEHGCTLIIYMLKKTRKPNLKQIP